jgi:glutathione peroxidase
MTGYQKYLPGKRTFVVLCLLLLGTTVYVYSVTAQNKSMTVRQRMLKSFYPVLMWFGKAGAKIERAPKATKAAVSFYDCATWQIDGTPFDLAALKGKKILAVNTASDCGFTQQFEELEALYQKYGDRLIVLGFPSNEFKQQEKGTDQEIATFCQRNFGVSFPLMKKGNVLASPDQQAVYRWLTNPALNGWNAAPPSWNFTKYLIDENGNLLAVFPPAIKPAGAAFTTELGL